MSKRVWRSIWNQQLILIRRTSKINTFKNKQKTMKLSLDLGCNQLSNSYIWQLYEYDMGTLTQICTKRLKITIIGILLNSISIINKRKY